MAVFTLKLDSLHVLRELHSYPIALEATALLLDQGRCEHGENRTLKV